MENLTKDDYKLQLQNEVYLHWLELNYSPSSWVDPSWLNAYGVGLHPQLLQRPAAQPWIKQTCFFEKLGLQELDWEFFQLPLARLLFSDRESLRHLMASLGAMCFQIQLHMIIEKSYRQQLFGYIPRNSWDFIEKTGPLLFVQRPELLNEIENRIPFWQPDTSQLVNLQVIGEHVFDKALRFCLAKNEYSGHRKSLSTWWRYYQLKFPLAKFTSETNEKTCSLPNVLLTINSAANQSIITLITKLVRHLEPKCLPLLK